MRFELQPVDGGTKLYFTQFFPAGFKHADGMPENERLGSDLPGGPDTPWRPGLLAGFHGSLTSLGTYLDGIGPTFEEMLATVSLRANRPLQILEARGLAPDHPVSVHCRENNYLKCYLFRVTT